MDNPDRIKDFNDSINEKIVYETHGRDTQTHVYFYENNFYVLSNFSSFQINAHNYVFMTSEHLYHWTRFKLSKHPGAFDVAERVRLARSAHDAFKIAQENKHLQVRNWDEIKFARMKEILHLKVAQHDYVKKKLLDTGDRILVEDSFRDPVWGSGPNGDGENWLGKLWMEVREEIRS